MPESQSLPRKLCELNKQILRSTVSSITSIAGTIGRSVERTADTSRVAGKTVAGQSRAAADQAGDTVARGAKDVATEVRDAASAAASTVATGVKTVVGQTRAQGQRVADRVDREVDHVVDEARRTADGRPGPGTPYEQWTKAQLLDRARELDIDGRATMNKAELVDALRV